MLQVLSCRNNIVAACCSSAGRPAGVCPAFALSAHAAQGRRVACDCPVPSTGCHVIQSKRIWRWYNVVLARFTCFWRSSGVYIYAFICVQYFKHTQIPLAIRLHTNICVALVQRPPRTSNEYWRTTDARQTLSQKSQFSVRRSCVDHVWLSLMVKKTLKNAGTERTYSAHLTRF